MKILKYTASFSSSCSKIFVWPDKLKCYNVVLIANMYTRSFRARCFPSFQSVRIDIPSHEARVLVRSKGRHRLVRRQVSRTNTLEGRQRIRGVSTIARERRAVRLSFTRVPLCVKYSSMCLSLTSLRRVRRSGTLRIKGQVLAEFEVPRVISLCAQVGVRYLCR